MASANFSLDPSIGQRLIEFCCAQVWVVILATLCPLALSLIQNQLRSRQNAPPRVQILWL